MNIDFLNRGFLFLPAETETPPVTEVEETIPETETSPEETQEDEEIQTEEDLNEDGINQAKILYKALLGPERDSIIAALAAKAGLLKQPEKVQTPAQERKAKKAIQDIIKEALPEYPALADRLGGAIEAVLEQEREERASEIQTLEQVNIQRDVDSAMNKIKGEAKGNYTPQIEAKMAELSSQLIKGEGVSTESYVRMLYQVASSGKATQKVTTQITDRIRRNASNTSDRLNTRTGGSAGTTGVSIPAKKGLRNAVLAAMESLEKQK